MRSFQLIVACFLFCSTATSAQTFYQANTENVIEVTRQINDKYGIFLDVPEILDVLYHLDEQLGAFGEIDPDLPIPSVSFDCNLTEGCFFSWESSEGSSFQYSFMDLATGATIVETTTDNSVQLPISSTILSLYTFFTYTDEGQSEIEIIIVDKDALFTDSGSGSGSSSSGESRQLKPIAGSVKLSPNPMHQQATLHFEQSETGPASISIFETISGRLVGQLLDGAILDKGPQRLSINASDWTAGHYFCLIKDQVSTRPIRFIKLK